MRFDRLSINVQGDDVCLRFHPQLTVFSGLGRHERSTLVENILGALTTTDETCELSAFDGTGRTLTISAIGGRTCARYVDDGSPTPPPIPSIAATVEALRALVLIRPADLGAPRAIDRPDEPHELREARSTLAQLTEALDAALERQHAADDLVAELAHLDQELAVARDLSARREYAKALARVERIRAEAAALDAGQQGIDADRRLLARADEAMERANRWVEAANQVRALRQRVVAAADGFVDDPTPLPDGVPDELPADLDALLVAAEAAQAERDSVARQLEQLTGTGLPSVSDPLVAELGPLEQEPLWAAAGELVTRLDDLDRLTVRSGGMGLDESGPAAELIHEIEAAHHVVEEAEQAAESVRLTGVTATALGASLALMGTFGNVLLIPLGLIGAAVAGGMLLLAPKTKVAQALLEERAILAKADAPSYLAFHMRRVDAAVDPSVRVELEAVLAEQRAARATWVALVGRDVDVRKAVRLGEEVQAYHAALRDLGEVADAIGELQGELTRRAEPALAQARAALQERCRPYGLTDEDLDDLSSVPTRLRRQVARAHEATFQVEVTRAESLERSSAAAVDGLLLELGFRQGDLAARLHAVEAAVEEAAEREEVRAAARDRDDVAAELAAATEMARRLRRPEWDDVTPDEAIGPDADGLEERRREVATRLERSVGDLDVERLINRHAAVERRVAALESRHHGADGPPDDGEDSLAEVRERLLARLTAASQAGPDGDPVPLVLDDALVRVPPDRKYDTLDLLLRLAGRHQLIYLSDDAFVSAWAHDQAEQGRILLLEPAPEPTAEAATPEQDLEPA